MRIVAGVAVGDEELRWIEPGARAPVPMAAEAKVPTAERDRTARFQGTVGLSAEQEEQVKRAPALHFRPAADPGAVEPSPSPAASAAAYVAESALKRPWTGTLDVSASQGVAGGARKAVPFSGTTALDPAQMEAALASPALPFQAGAAPRVGLVVSPEPQPPRDVAPPWATGTITVEPEAGLTLGAPGRLPAPSAPIPEVAAAVPSPAAFPEPPPPPAFLGVALPPEPSVHLGLAPPPSPSPSPAPGPSPRAGGAPRTRRLGEPAERVVLSFSSAPAGVTPDGPPPASPGEHFLAAMERAGERIDPA